MQDKPTAAHAVGLMREGKFVRAARLSQRKGQPCVDSAFTFEVSPNPEENTHVNPLYTPEINGGKEKELVVSALDAREVLIRPLELKLTNERDIEAVLGFQVEPLLPYPLESASIDKITLSKNDQGTLLSILVARKDHIQAHLEKWKQLKIEPEVISCVPVALASFADATIPPSSNPIYIFDFGLEFTTCVLAKEGKVLAAHAFCPGIETLIEGFAIDRQLKADEAKRELLLLDFQYIDETKLPTVSSTLQLMSQTLLQTSYALSKYAKGQETREILVTGIGEQSLILPQCSVKR